MRGNVQTRTVDGHTSTYRYDPLNRLKSEAGAANQSFGLDANGNRSSDGQATYTVLAKKFRLTKTRTGFERSVDNDRHVFHDVFGEVAYLAKECPRWRATSQGPL